MVQSELKHALPIQRFTVYRIKLSNSAPQTNFTAQCYVSCLIRASIILCGWLHVGGGGGGGNSSVICYDIPYILFY